MCVQLKTKIKLRTPSNIVQMGFICRTKLLESDKLFITNLPQTNYNFFSQKNTSLLMLQYQRHTIVQREKNK